MTAFDNAMWELWRATSVHEFFTRLGHILTLPNSGGTKGEVMLRRVDLEVMHADPELMATLDMIPSEGLTVIDVADRRFMVRRAVGQTFNFKKQKMIEHDAWVFYSISGYFEIDDSTNKERS